MAQQIAAWTAVAGDGATVEDVDLGALAVELRFRDVARSASRAGFSRREQSIGGMNVIGCLSSRVPARDASRQLAAITAAQLSHGLPSRRCVVPSSRQIVIRGIHAACASE
jgi:hypothetical protein